MTNSLGDRFKVTSFGESHGECVGVVVDGCPAGLTITESDIQVELDKRKPGAGTASTTRSEEDKVEILSGVFNGHTTGAPICMIIRNTNTDSKRYEKSKDMLRPGHADYTAFIKYGGFNDYRGGGRFSGRITAGFVMAGAVAQKLLAQIGIEVISHTVEIGGIKAFPKNIKEIRLADKNELKCADLKADKEMLNKIEHARGDRDSLGGIIESIALNVPAGLGEPVFGNLDGDLSRALFAIPAVKGVEFGAGFALANMRGSQNNDPFTFRKGKIQTVTNNSGGILGGISNGMPVVARVAIKPTPSIALPQGTVNISTMENDELEIKGRHDVCIVPRAVPVVTAMMSIVLCDHAIRGGLIPEVLK